MSSSKTGAALSLNVQGWSRAQKRDGCSVSASSLAQVSLARFYFRVCLQCYLGYEPALGSLPKRGADFLQTSRAELRLQAFLRQTQCSSVQQQVYFEGAGVTCSPSQPGPDPEALGSLVASRGWLCCLL